MLLFATPVCDSCKATAQDGKETDAEETLECNRREEVKHPVPKNALFKINSHLRVSELLGSRCGADVRRFFGNANCYEAQALTFRLWVP